MNTNYAGGTSYADLTIDSSGITEIDAVASNLMTSSGDVRSEVKWSYFKSSSSSYNLAGLSISATYAKTNVNTENRQMYFALPGSWSVTTNNSASGSSGGLTGTASYTAQKGDVVFTISSQNYDGYSSHGTTVSNSTSCLNSQSRWYQNTNVRIFVIDTAGSVTIDANGVFTNYVVFRKD